MLTMMTVRCARCMCAMAGVCRCLSTAQHSIPALMLRSSALPIALQDAWKPLVCSACSGHTGVVVVLLGGEKLVRKERKMRHRVVWLRE